MSLKIVESPRAFALVGKSGHVPDRKYGEVGLTLMNAMWAEVKRLGLRNDGVNHWVYLAGDRMFVGVGLTEPASEIGTLERYAFELPRYVESLHVGLYSDLPAAWKDLSAEIVALGERETLPSLEVYGHCSPDPQQAQTTILIGLKQKI